MSVISYHSTTNLHSDYRHYHSQFIHKKPFLFHDIRWPMVVKTIIRIIKPRSLEFGNGAPCSRDFYLLSTLPRVTFSSMSSGQVYSLTFYYSYLSNERDSPSKVSQSLDGRLKTNKPMYLHEREWGNDQNNLRSRT